MDFNTIVLAGVIGLFTWYMFSVTRSYNRNKKRLANHGPDQVIQSMLRVLNGKADVSHAQFIPWDMMLADSAPPILDDTLDGIREVFDRWADVREFNNFNLSITIRGSLVNGIGHRSHFVVAVVYQCNNEPAVTVDLNLAANYLGRCQVYQEAYLDTLNVMHSANKG